MVIDSLPWKINPQIPTQIMDCKGEVVALLNVLRSTAASDAAFIVQLCNAYRNEDPNAKD